MNTTKRRNIIDAVLDEYVVDLLHDHPRQSPCPCSVCSRDEPLGCFGADNQRTQRPDEMCSYEGCECWGGSDRECEACWIDGK